MQKRPPIHLATGPRSTSRQWTDNHPSGQVYAGRSTKIGRSHLVQTAEVGGNREMVAIATVDFYAQVQQYENLEVGILLGPRDYCTNLALGRQIFNDLNGPGF
jgi:hypothetical protein